VANNIGKRFFSLKVVILDSQTRPNTHWRPFALPVPLKYSVKWVSSVNSGK